MIKKDSDGFSDGEWDDLDELRWTEFDWEKYLRGQDDVVLRYIGFYEQEKDSDERVDGVADLMGWNVEQAAEADDENAEEEEAEDPTPYTVQRNPVYVATTAIYLGLTRSWERFVDENPERVPASLAIAVQGALYRGERQALLGIHALDLGDFSLAVSLLKRALRELNATFHVLGKQVFCEDPKLEAYRIGALPCLFDLREIWLRIIAECREESQRQDKPADDEEVS